MIKFRWLVTLLVITSGYKIFSQTPITLDEALQLALKNNPTIKAASLEIDYQRWKASSIDVPKTTALLTYGQYNSIMKNDNNISISQTIPFPTVWARQQSAGKAMIKSSGLQKECAVNNMTYNVSLIYYELLYLHAKKELLQLQDSLLEGLTKAANARYQAGEGNLIEKTSAETQWNEIENHLRQNDADILIQRSRLKTLLQNNQDVTVAGNIEDIPVLEPQLSVAQNPELKYFAQQIEVGKVEKKLEIANAMPEIIFGYFNQTLIGYQTINNQEQYFGSSKRFHGFQAGLTVPLWFFSQNARIKAASTLPLIAEQNYKSYEQTLTGHLEQAQQEYAKANSSVLYYASSALPNSTSLIRQTEIGFKNGEIDYTSHLTNLQNALRIRSGYLDALLLLHQSRIHLNYLSGNSQLRN